jgi:hypothetical protein
MRIDSLLFLAIGVIAIGLTLSAIRGYGNSWTVGSRLNQDDAWTVIEYPEGQEVAVELKAGASMPEAKASARVMRSGSETTVNLDVSGATGSETNHQVYIVDSLGNATLLGTLTITDGAGTLSGKTALSKFMIVVSPEDSLTAIGADTKVSFRSAVPEGFAIVPREPKNEVVTVEPPSSSVEPSTGNEEPQPTQPAVVEYDVPLIDLASLKRGSKLKVKLSSGFENAKATAVISPQKNGPTQIRIQFTNLKEIPEGTQYILWQVEQDNSYTPLGHLTATAKKGDLLVNADTSATNFGLLITFENADASRPAGSMVATVLR